MPEPHGQWRFVPPPAGTLPLLTEAPRHFATNYILIARGDQLWQREVVVEFAGTIDNYGSAAEVWSLAALRVWRFDTFGNAVPGPESTPVTPSLADVIRFRWTGRVVNNRQIATACIPPGEYEGIVLAVTNITSDADTLQYQYRASLTDPGPEPEVVALRPRDLVRLRVHQCNPPED
jgi:hypothetical protein